MASTKEMLQMVEQYCPNIAVWRISGDSVVGNTIESHLDSLDLAALNTLMEETGYKVSIGGRVDRESGWKDTVDIEVRISQ